jgi:hypothetical protein
MNHFVCHNHLIFLRLRDSTREKFLQLSLSHAGPCYISAMGKTVGRWVVYERQGGEFVYLSKPLKTKAQAESERLKLAAKYPRAAIGVGFIRISS